MAYNDVRTPEAHAAATGNATLDPQTDAIEYTVGHIAAAQLHGWEAHKRATTEAFTLLEGYYLEAITAALAGSVPYASALSPYAISGTVPPIGPGKHLVESDALQPWVTFEDLELPALSTQVFDYVVRAYGYLESTPTTRVTEVAVVRVTRDGSGNASLLSAAAPFVDSRLRITVGTDDITVDVQAHASQDWIWDTEAVRQVSGSTLSIHLPSGSTVAASGVIAPTGASVTGGVLDLTSLSAVAGLKELLDWANWRTLYLPPSYEGITHTVDAGSVAQWSDLSGNAVPCHWTQATHARQPPRGRLGALQSLQFTRASTHYMTRTPPTYTGLTGWTRIIGIAHTDTTSECLMAPTSGYQLRVNLHSQGGNSMSIFAGGAVNCVYAATGGDSAMHFYSIRYDGTQASDADRLAIRLGTGADQAEALIGTIQASLTAQATEWLGCSEALAAYFQGHVCFMGEIASTVNDPELASLQQGVYNILGV